MIPAGIDGIGLRVWQVGVLKWKRKRCAMEEAETVVTDIDPRFCNLEKLLMRVLDFLLDSSGQA